MDKILVTLQQMKSIVDWVKQRLSGKVDVGGRAEVQEITVGGAYTVSVGSDNKLTITDSDSSVNVMTMNQDGIMAHALDTDLIATTEKYDAERKMYCFESSSPRAHQLASTPKLGGGVILTTRNRGLEKALHNGNGEAVSIGADPYVYFYAYDVSEATVSLADLNNGAVNEYWIEIQFTNNREDSHTVTFVENDELRWPVAFDSTDLIGATVQFHIINKIVTYTIVR